MLEDKLFKTSELQIDSWLFGPEKVAGLSRNGLQNCYLNNGSNQPAQQRYHLLRPTGNKDNNHS